MTGSVRTMQPQRWRRYPLVLCLALGVGACAEAERGHEPGNGRAAEESATDEAHREVVFVANAAAGTVTAIDSRQFESLREYDVTPDATLDDDETDEATRSSIDLAGIDNFAQDQAVSPDGRTLYVARGHLGDVAAFDLASGDMLWTAAVSGPRADHMTISPGGRRLYVSAIFANRVEVLDSEDGAALGHFEGGEWPHDNRMSQDGARVYNTSIGNLLTPRERRRARAEAPDPQEMAPYQLTIADAETLEVLETHRFEDGIRPWVMTADERLLYAQLSCLHGIIEYDMEAREELRRIELPLADGASADCDDAVFEAPHHGLALSKDDQWLCAAARISNYVAIVPRDAFSHEETAIIPVGEGPGWAANDVSGEHCWVPSESGTVSAISYRTREEVARIPTGAGAKHTVSARVPESVICGRAAEPDEPYC